MKKIIPLILLLLLAISSQAQPVFTRSVLNTSMALPWEITYGADNFLWLTESNGRVARVDPVSGNKTVVYTASDYFEGDTLERFPICHRPNIGVGTLGLALHPDFPNTGYVYFIYSYNSGTALAPATKFKIVRLNWDSNTSSVTGDMDLVTLIPTSYDHLGGRLLAVNQNGKDYLYLSIGDHGFSEDNSPSCYNPQSLNPNNLAQDPAAKNGKIHRYNIDGTIPADNPIAGNSFFTRGHRNPQGLMYNPVQDLVYDVEHGDRTDDEINVLYAGMNYGWKNVRGYHGDNNFPGESDYISNYSPHPSIANDSLVEALYSWCTDTMPATSNFLDWCTVAPSGGIYYGSTGIPSWTNSILAVTLKDGTFTDRSVYQLKLSADGKSRIPSTPSDPNPKQFFAADQALNGRIRDIAVSPDGLSIYLINNTGANTSKIIVYTASPVGVADLESYFALSVYPNPSKGLLKFKTEEKIVKAEIFNLFGQGQLKAEGDLLEMSIAGLEKGIYLLTLTSKSGKSYSQRIIRE